jgi:hypothetical protein
VTDPQGSTTSPGRETPEPVAPRPEPVAVAGSRPDPPPTEPETPGLESSGLESPGLESPELESPDLESSHESSDESSEAEPRAVASYPSRYPHLWLMYLAAGAIAIIVLERHRICHFVRTAVEARRSSEFGDHVHEPAVKACDGHRFKGE